MDLCDSGMRGVAVAQDDVISLISLSRLGCDRSQCSDWLLIVLQWAEFAAHPMSVLGHTVVSSRGCERLNIRHIFRWCNPFVTGSLFFVDIRRQAAAGSCGVVLCSSQVLAGVLLCAEDCAFRAVSVAQPVSGMVTGCGPPELGCPDPSTHSAGRSDSTITGTLRLGTGVCPGCVGPACPTPGGAVGSSYDGA